MNVVTTAANARPMMNATAISTRLPFAMKSRNSFSMTASPRRPQALYSDPSSSPEPTPPFDVVCFRCVVYEVCTG